MSVDEETTLPNNNEEKFNKAEDPQLDDQGEGDENTQERRDLAYQAFLTGWLTNKLERDKSILTLAGGGIAVAVTLITTIGPDSISMLAVFIISLISFLVCLITLVFTFDENANYISQVIKRQPPDRRLLTLFNRVGLWSMLIGSILLSLAGGMAGYAKLEDFKQSHEKSKTEKSSLEKEPNERVIPPATPPQPPSISINVGGTENHIILPSQSRIIAKSKPPCPETHNTQNESDQKK